MSYILSPTKHQISHVVGVEHCYTNAFPCRPTGQPKSTQKHESCKVCQEMMLLKTLVKFRFLQNSAGLLGMNMDTFTRLIGEIIVIVETASGKQQNTSFLPQCHKRQQQKQLDPYTTTYTSLNQCTPISQL